MAVGIDLVEVPRIRRSMESERFIKRIFTGAEQTYIDSRGVSRYQTAAGIFAAKEAFIKAIGQAVPFQDISVSRQDSGAPFIELSEKAGALLNGRKINLSITHTDKYAAAVIMLEK